MRSVPQINAEYKAVSEKREQLVKDIQAILDRKQRMSFRSITADQFRKYIEIAEREYNDAIVALVEAEKKLFALDHEVFQTRLAEDMEAVSILTHVHPDKMGQC
jgi:hypothetical protein